MNNTIVVDVGTWAEGYDEENIICEVMKAIYQEPLEIYIIGNFSKWIKAMENNQIFAIFCLFATFNNIRFTDDGANDKIYSIYEVNIFKNDLSYFDYRKEIDSIHQLKRHYDNIDKWAEDVIKLNLPNFLLK